MSKDTGHNEPISTPDGGEVLIYRTDDGLVKIDIHLVDETLWMTQQMIAQLFQTSVPNVNMHIKNIYDDQELQPEATIKEFLIVR